MRLTAARTVCVLVTAALVSWAPTAAIAVPSPTPNPTSSPTAPEPAKGTLVCAITDQNAIGLSGLVSAKGFLYGVNDSTTVAAQKKVFKFNPTPVAGTGTKPPSCPTVGTGLSYPTGPLDPEDLAIDPNGEIWIADIGDNTLARPTIALWKIINDKIDGPYRMAYPDGKKHDAEALLFDAQGAPIIITKAVSEPTTQLFSPTGPLDKASKEGVPLKALGEVTLPKTTTDNPLKAPGRNMVTGAATSPDRSKVVLRTYADAIEYPVVNGDIVAAITKGTPKVTPLPNEAWGEAITYSADGKNFLTVSDVDGLGDSKTRPQPQILSYVPSTEVYKAPGTATAVTVPPPAKKAWWSSLISSTKRLYMLIGAIGVFGLLLVLFGVLGISRSRKRRRREAEEAEEEERTRMMHYPPQGYYDQGYGQQQYPGYGYPQQQPGYGYPQQQPGYGYPDQGYGQQQQQPGYGYPPPQPYPEQYPPQGYPDQGYGQGYR